MSTRAGVVPRRVTAREDVRSTDQFVPERAANSGLVTRNTEAVTTDFTDSTDGSAWGRILTIRAIRGSFSSVKPGRGQSSPVRVSQAEERKSKLDQAQSNPIQPGRTPSDPIEPDQGRSRLIVHDQATEPGGGGMKGRLSACSVIRSLFGSPQASRNTEHATRNTRNPVAFSSSLC